MPCKYLLYCILYFLLLYFYFFFKYDLSSVGGICKFRRREYRESILLPWINRLILMSKTSSLIDLKRTQSRAGNWMPLCCESSLFVQYRLVIWVYFIFFSAILRHQTLNSYLLIIITEEIFTALLKSLWIIVFAESSNSGWLQRWPFAS